MSSINGISAFHGGNENNGIGIGAGGAQMDSVSKNIQRQIAEKQKELKELSTKKEMPQEEKMKKRQEIQQEISMLQQQLHEHQIEERKKQQMEKKRENPLDNSTDRSADSAGQLQQDTLLMADSARKQAKVQGSAAKKLEGRAGVLETELKLDRAGGNEKVIEKKEAELADMQAKAQSAKQAAMTTLAEANEKIEEKTKAGKDKTKIETDDAEAEKAESDKAEAVQAAAGYVTVDVRI